MIACIAADHDKRYTCAVRAGLAGTWTQLGRGISKRRDWIIFGRRLCWLSGVASTRCAPLHNVHLLPPVLLLPQICQVYDSAECVRNIHPDARWRHAATQACQVSPWAPGIYPNMPERCSPHTVLPAAVCTQGSELGRRKFCLGQRVNRSSCKSGMRSPLGLFATPGCAQAVPIGIEQ